MAFSYLDETNIFDRYTAAKKYTDSLTQPFPEFARIARNRAHEAIDPKYPRTTDGTTASIIRKTPRRIIQQLPTGRVEGDAEDWLTTVADFIFTHKILPFANEEYDLIQKCWTLVESGLTFGFAATYTPFVNHDGYFCPDVTPIYWGDLAIQPGKKSGYSAKYVFMRSWWQQEDIDALIDREKKLAQAVKDRQKQQKASGQPVEADYESTWDLQALEEIKQGASTKDAQSRTPVESERGIAKDGVELITGFQDGVGAQFLTFAGRKIVRRETNKDPRGKKPIDWLYGDIDGTNPLGRGIVELVGGLQNLIDSDMQMYQYNRALMLAPPLVKYGTFSKNRVQFVPNAVIDVGSDPNAKVIPLTVDTSAVINYPSLYGLQKSQLLNLVSSPDTSISADVGNPGFSKTPAGINQQKASISVDDNYIRKMFEAWFENWSETAINLYFAKRSGVEELQLDDDTAERLKKLGAEGKFDLSLLSEDDKILIDYDSATPALKFHVDASTSKMKDDSEQLTALTGLAGEVAGNPLLMQLLQQYPEKLVALYNAIISNSAVEEPEELTIDLDEFKKKMELAQQQQQAQAQQMPQGQPPVQGQPQGQPQQAPQMSPEDQQLMMQLKQLGLPDQVIQGALAQLNQGVPAGRIIQQLQGVMSGR